MSEEIITICRPGCDQEREHVERHRIRTHRRSALLQLEVGRKKAQTVQSDTGLSRPAPFDQLDNCADKTTKAQNHAQRREWVVASRGRVKPQQTRKSVCIPLPPPRANIQVELNSLPTTAATRSFCEPPAVTRHCSFSRDCQAPLHLDCLSVALRWHTEIWRSLLCRFVNSSSPFIVLDSSRCLYP